MTRRKHVEAKEDPNFKLNYKSEIQLYDNYSTNRNQFLNMLSEL